MRIWIFIILTFLFSSANAASVPSFYGPVQQVSVDRANISFYRFGSGKPLVMITGHGDNINMWPSLLLKHLSEHRTIIIFDYPGIGKSTIKGEFPSSFDELTSLIQAFIKTQKLNKPDVLGFSMGGSLLLYLATQHSEDYDHLIVIGAKAGGKQTVQPSAANFNLLKNTDVSPAVVIKTLLFPASAGKQADAYINGVMQLPQENMDKTALAAQAAAVTSDNEGAGIWNDLPRIHNKILVLNGTEDILTPVQNAVMIAAAIPGAWLVQVQGAGHGVLFQEPDFAERLLGLFLQN
jgi:pimeloyl-ACP methyl ester carboxylesterase